MRMNLISGLSLALLASLLCVAWWLWSGAPAAGTPQGSGAYAPHTAPATTLTPVAASGGTTAGSPPLFRQDDAGHLILDADTAISLALQCEQPVATVQSGLSPEARLQVSRLQPRFCRYLQQYTRQQAAQPIPESPDAAQQQLAALVALRRRHFDADTAQRLFGAEEAHAAFTLAVAGLQQDGRLGPAEREAAISRLRNALPPEVARLETPPALIESAQRALEDQAGAEAGQQVQKTADIEQAWATRYLAFKEQKQSILRAALAESDKAAQIEQLLRAHYAADELTAARAYDRQQEGR